MIKHTRDGSLSEGRVNTSSAILSKADRLVNADWLEAWIGWMLIGWNL